MAIHIPKPVTLQKALPFILIIAGIVGCIASLMLTYEIVQTFKNPDYDPICNLNPVLSCGSVMSTEQSSLMGIPNTIFGFAAFSTLALFGLVLAAGAKLKRWLWLGAQVAATVGVLFMHYLFFQSLYRIQAICPWCFVVWITTIPVFWYVTLYNLREEHVKLSSKFSQFNNFLQRNHGNILLVWYAVILLLILQRFWYYWSSLL